MKITKRQLRHILVEELLKTDEPGSEMRQFSSSNPGKKVVKAGEKIKSAGKTINDLAYEQTGKARATLSHIAEFTYKLGEALATINEIEEGSSVSEKLPTIAELKQLHKEIQRLEKI